MTVAVGVGATAMGRMLAMARVSAVVIRTGGTDLDWADVAIGRMFAVRAWSD